MYTGANPANSESQGLSGYINQVIKTGTYPGYAQAELGIGTPRSTIARWSKPADRRRTASSRTTSALRATTRTSITSTTKTAQPRTIGSGAPMSLAPNTSYAPTTNYLVGTPAPWYYYMGPFNYALQSGISARDAVVNFHVGIPHSYDAGRDDVQLLWDSESLHNNFYSSTNDITSTTGCGGSHNGSRLRQCNRARRPGIHRQPHLELPGVRSAHVHGPGLARQAAGCVDALLYPVQHEPYGLRLSRSRPGLSDTTWNNQEIVKLQYTKNFGSTAFLRIYGYTYYSDWLQNGPQTLYADFAGCCPPDYELSSHTRGVSVHIPEPDQRAEPGERSRRRTSRQTVSATTISSTPSVARLRRRSSVPPTRIAALLRHAAGLVRRRSQAVACSQHAGRPSGGTVPGSGGLSFGQVGHCSGLARTHVRRRTV